MIKITSADRYFSLCVRERAGWTCERCGAQHPPPTVALHCAHFHSRGSWSTRFDPANALALCYGCHQYTAVHREEHAKLHRRVVGELEFDRIWHDSRRPVHRIRTRKAEAAQHYRRQWEAMQARRIAGETGRIDFEGWTP